MPGVQGCARRVPTGAVPTTQGSDMIPDTPEAQAHLVLFTALAEAYGANRTAAAVIAEQVLNEFDGVALSKESAEQIDLRILDLAC